MQVDGINRFYQVRMCNVDNKVRTQKLSFGHALGFVQEALESGESSQAAKGTDKDAPEEASGAVEAGSTSEKALEWTVFVRGADAKAPMKRDMGIAKVIFHLNGEEEPVVLQEPPFEVTHSYLAVLPALNWHRCRHPCISSEGASSP